MRGRVGGKRRQRGRQGCCLGWSIRSRQGYRGEGDALGRENLENLSCEDRYCDGEPRNSRKSPRELALGPGDCSPAARTMTSPERAGALRSEAKVGARAGIHVETKL